MEVVGLRVVVGKAGRKFFDFRYRFNRRKRVMRIGEFPSVSLKEARERWVRSFERQYLEEALRVHGGNVAAAARASGMDRIQFYRLLWRHGLKKSAGKGSGQGNDG